MEPKSKIFSKDDRSLYYYVRGNGKFPVIVMHGQGSSGKSFYNGVDISLPNTTTYYIDLPGHGDSFNLTLQQSEDWVDLLVDFCKSLSSKKIILVGFSLGGEIGLLVSDKLVHDGYESFLFMWSTPLMLNSRNSVEYIPRFGMSIGKWLNAIFRNTFIRKLILSIGIRFSDQDCEDIINTNPYTFDFANKLFKTNITNINERVKFRYLYGDHDAFVNYKKIVPEIEKIRPESSVYISGCQHFGNEVGWKNAVEYLKEEIGLINTLNSI